ncbi:hypothetical protein HDU98_009949 [Podochytrium sp. JEL0797]|nr:hypothetical protein HDU98_009949 [Podochytrium sp. JEL0797]
MGVHGLSTFLRDQTGGATTVTFSRPTDPSSKQYLIVDGNALVHIISQSSPIDSIPTLTAAVLDFVTHLAHVFHLTVYFDGPLPKWKHQQRMTREKEKIVKLEREYRDSILSPLSLIGCIQTLCAATQTTPNAEFCVRVAEGEADLAITHLARLQNAYISSLDSDFFIHTCRGYLPLDGLSASPVDGTVSAAFWSYSVAAKQLGIHPTVLPLLAYVMGCDYTINEREWVNMNVRLGTATGSVQKRIRTTAAHLKPFQTLQEGIESLLPKNAAREDQEAVEAELWAIANLFTGKEAVAGSLDRFPALPFPSSRFAYVPTIAEARKSHKFVEILNSAFWCQCLVEDLTRSPAWEVSRPIRRKLYHLLGLNTVGEYIRRGSEFRVEHVDSIAFPHSSLITDPLEVYKSVMDASTVQVPTTHLPLIASIRYLAQQWKDTPFQLKNFEVVALLCMSLHYHRGNSLNTSASPPNTPPPPTATSARSKQTMHLLASLETILFSAWLVAQAATAGCDSTATLESVAFEHAHWNTLDADRYGVCLMQAKTGRGPQFLLGEEGVREFEGLYAACLDGGGVVEVVDYGSLKAGGGGEKKVKKKKRDVAMGGVKSGKKGKVVAGLSKADQNIFSFLGEI